LQIASVCFTNSSSLRGKQADGQHRPQREQHYCQRQPPRQQNLQDDRRQQACPQLVPRRQLHVETALGDIPYHPTPAPRHEKQARHLRRLQQQDVPQQ
jgi:hypothetical protein